MSTLKKIISELIANGDLEAAVEMLEKEFVNANEKLQTDLVLIRSNFAELTQQLRNPTRDEDAITVMRNKLKVDILSVTKEYERKSIPFQITNAMKPAMELSFIVGGLVICLVLGGLAVLLTKFNSCLPSKHSQDVPAATQVAPSKDFNKMVDSLYYGEITQMYHDYQNIYVAGALNKTEKLLKTADDLDDYLKKEEYIDTTKLDPYNVIHRLMGLTIIYKIRSLLTDKTEKKLDYSRKAMKYGTQVKTALDDAKNQSGIEKENLLKWIADEHHYLRADINMFIAKTSNHLAGGEIALPELQSDYNRLKTDLTKEGYAKYLVLQQLNQKYPKIFTAFKKPNT